MCVSVLLLHSVTSAAGHKDKTFASSHCWWFYYLHPAAGVLFDPLDDRLVHQLLGFSVEAVVRQVGHQILLGNVQDLLLAGHLSSGGTMSRKKHRKEVDVSVTFSQSFSLYHFA